MVKKSRKDERHKRLLMEEEWKESKPKRKKRKPMTEEQRKASAERLAKAREAKGAAQYKNVHPSVIALPDNNPLSYKNVRLWIKSNRDRSREYKRESIRNVKGALAKYADCDGYVRQMQHYLKHGDWIGNFYGEHQEGTIKWKIIAPKGM